MRFGVRARCGQGVGKVCARLVPLELIVINDADRHLLGALVAARKLEGATCDLIVLPALCLLILGLVRHRHRAVGATHPLDLEHVCPHRLNHTHRLLHPPQHALRRHHLILLQMPRPTPPALGRRRVDHPPIALAARRRARRAHHNRNRPISAAAAAAAAALLLRLDARGASHRERRRRRRRPHIRRPQLGRPAARRFAARRLADEDMPRQPTHKAATVLRLRLAWRELPKHVGEVGRLDRARIRAVKHARLLGHIIHLAIVLGGRDAVCLAAALSTLIRNVRQCDEKHQHRAGDETLGDGDDIGREHGDDEQQPHVRNHREGRRDQEDIQILDRACVAVSREA